MRRLAFGFTRGGGEPPAFTVSIGSGDVTTGTLLTATITPDPSPLTPTYQWTDDGVNIAGRTSATYTPAIGTDSVADLSQIRCVVTIDSEPYTSNARRIVYAAPTFSQQPQITGTPYIGNTLTLVEGTAGPNATLEIVTFTLAGVDKTGELSGLDWDTTGESPGEIAFRVSATNSGGTTLSNIITANLIVDPAVDPILHDVTFSSPGGNPQLDDDFTYTGEDTLRRIGAFRAGGSALTAEQLIAGTGTFVHRFVIENYTGSQVSINAFANEETVTAVDSIIVETNNGGQSAVVTEAVSGLAFDDWAFSGSSITSSPTIAEPIVSGSSITG